MPENQQLQDEYNTLDQEIKAALNSGKGSFEVAEKIARRRYLRFQIAGIYEFTEEACKHFIFSFHKDGAALLKQFGGSEA